MILAFAVRTNSVLVGICSGCGAFVTLPTVGIIGVVRIQARATGCVLIGPVVGLILGMLDNSFLPSSFKTKPGAWCYLTPMRATNVKETARHGAELGPSFIGCQAQVENARRLRGRGTLQG